MSDAVNDAYEDAVRNRVRTLNRPPSVVLCIAPLGLLGRMPPDRGGIKDDARAFERRQACAFRIPLIPANQRADFSFARVESLVAEIAGREIELLVIKRIVRNVHLAIHAFERSVRIEDCGSVVVNAGRAFFKQGSYERDLLILRHFAEALGGGSGNRFGKIEKRVVFALAEILCLEEFGQADDLRALSGSFL